MDLNQLSDAIEGSVGEDVGYAIVLFSEEQAAQFITNCEVEDLPATLRSIADNIDAGHITRQTGGPEDV